MCRDSFKDLTRKLGNMCRSRLIDVCKSAGLTKSQQDVVVCRVGRSLDVPTTGEEVGMCETRVISAYCVGMKRIEDYINYTSGVK